MNHSLAINRTVGWRPSQYPKLSQISKELNTPNHQNKTFLVFFFSLSMTLSLCAFLLLLPHLNSPKGILPAVHLIPGSFYCPGSHFPAERLDTSVHHRKLRPRSSHAFPLAASVSFYLIFFPLCFRVLSFRLPLSLGFKLIIFVVQCTILVTGLVSTKLKYLKILL